MSNIIQKNLVQFSQKALSAIQTAVGALERLDPALFGGVDTDFWLGKWDSAVAALNGVKFVFVRVSQNTWPDRQFKNSWSTSKGIIVRGGYCFITKAISNDGQARTFANQFPNNTYDGELPIVLDLEEDVWYPAPKGQKKKQHLDISDAEAFLAALPNYLKGWNGKYVIYTNYYWWIDFGSQDPKYASVPLWFANPPPYSSPDKKFNPALPKPFLKADFIQISFAGDGNYYGGESTGIDLDYYMGTKEQFDQQFGLTGPTPQPVPTPLPVPTPNPDPIPDPAPLPPPSTTITIHAQLFGGKIIYDKIVAEKYTAHVMVVDMTTGAKLFLSPPNRNGYLTPMTAEAFLHWQNLQLCMNGPDQFYWTRQNRKDLVYPSGLAAFQGNVYHKSTNEETVYIDQNNVCTLVPPANAKAVWNAASFPKRAVIAGQVISVIDASRKPRNAFGWTQDGTKIVFIKVDGNEAQGLGATFGEVSQIMVDYNVWDAVHGDGGYSSQMAIEDANGLPQQIGVPANNNVPGQVSQVGQLIGVYWE